MTLTKISESEKPVNMTNTKKSQYISSDLHKDTSAQNVTDTNRHKQIMSVTVMYDIPYFVTECDRLGHICKPLQRMTLSYEKIKCDRVTGSQAL